jgi:hypothetical protein
VDAYAATHLFAPLGITAFYWKRAPGNLPDTQSGLYLHRTDLAKIGYLYLQDGWWGASPPARGLGAGLHTPRHAACAPRIVAYPDGIMPRLAAHSYGWLGWGPPPSSQVLAGTRAFSEVADPRCWKHLLHFLSPEFHPVFAHRYAPSVPCWRPPRASASSRKGDKRANIPLDSVDNLYYWWASCRGTHSYRWSLLWGISVDRPSMSHLERRGRKEVVASFAWALFPCVADTPCYGQ